MMEMKSGTVSDNFRLLLSHSVKQSGLNFRNPVPSAARLHQALSEASVVLVKSLMLMEGGSLNLVEHNQCVRQEGATVRKERTEEEKAFV